MIMKQKGTWNFVDILKETNNVKNADPPVFENVSSLHDFKNTSQYHETRL